MLFGFRVLALGFRVHRALRLIGLLAMGLCVHGLTGFIGLKLMRFGVAFGKRAYIMKGLTGCRVGCLGNPCNTLSRSRMKPIQAQYNHTGMCPKTML